jgi:hypothetical protein
VSSTAFYRLSILPDTGGEIPKRKLSNKSERQKGKGLAKIEAKITDM